jgi:hypothetical protein
MAASLSILPLILLGLLIAGFAMIALGIRGRPVFSSPRCARCSYDLRAVNFMTQQAGTCPECGADLSTPRAVTFGKLQKRPGLIALGIGLALSPLLLVPVMYLARSSRVMTPAVGPRASRARTTPALIASLSTNKNQPWDWQELERRLGAGSLTSGEVDAAFNVLINDLNANRAAGRAQEPLHWANAFLKPAIQRNAVNPQVLSALCQAFYGSAPRIKSRRRTRQAQPMEVEIDLDGHWNLPGMQACWSLKHIKAADGSDLTPTYAYDERSPNARNPDQFSGTNRGQDVRAKLAHSLAPGEHELAFTFDLGTVADTATLRGLDGKPGTPDKWPSPITTWQTVVKQKVIVVSPEQSVVDLITDPAQDPFNSIKLGVDEALVRTHTQGAQIVLKWTPGQYADPPISYHVTLVAGDQQIDFGAIFTARVSGGSNSSMATTKVVKSLPADVKTIDLLFTPDPKNAERFLGVEQIWGGHYKIENVKLERFDIGSPK